MKERRKKILFIVQLPPPVHGASTINKLMVESKLVNSHFNVRVLPLKFISNINEMGSFSFRKIWLMLIFMIRLVKEMVAFRPNLVYYTIAPKGFPFYRDFVFIVLIKLFGRRIVYHLHRRGIQQALRKSRFSKWLYRNVYQGAFVVCIAQSVKSEFDGFDLMGIYFLPNGITAQQIDTTSRESDKPTLLFLSNLFIDKGILVFLAIIKRLKSCSLPFSASIIGTDGDITAEQLRTMIVSEGLDDTVSVLGPIFGEEKNNILGKASIFVMPSLDEIFPLVILEAMQASLPVVASSVGAIPEIVEDGVTGYLCKAGDVNMFSDRITSLLTDTSLRERLSSESKKIFVEKYTTEVFESNLLKILQSLT